MIGVITGTAAPIRQIPDFGNLLAGEVILLNE